MPSIYQLCSQAAKRLAQSDQPFIDIEVAQEAYNQGWNQKNVKEAQKHANQICGVMYRAGKLVRYGPVEFEGETDYVRHAGRIVYGGAETGPETIETPNGTFKRVYDREDTLATVGRRKNSTRDDLQSWEDQAVAAPASGGAPMLVDGAPLMQRINELEAKFRRAEADRERLEKENERLRTHAVASSSSKTAAVGKPSGDQDALLEMMSAMEERLAKLEGKTTKLVEMERIRIRLNKNLDETLFEDEQVPA